MKNTLFPTIICTLLLASSTSHLIAGNIVWVSDLLPIGSGTSDSDGGALGTFTPGPGPYLDEGFLNLLTRQATT